MLVIIVIHCCYGDVRQAEAAVVVLHQQCPLPFPILSRIMQLRLVIFTLVALLRFQFSTPMRWLQVNCRLHYSQRSQLCRPTLRWVCLPCTMRIFRDSIYECAFIQYLFFMHLCNCCVTAGLPASSIAPGLLPQLTMTPMAVQKDGQWHMSSTLQVCSWYIRKTC